MNEEPTKDLATRAFQKRVLDEFAAVRCEQATFAAELSAMRTEQIAMRAEQTAIRTEQTAMRAEQTEMRQDIAVLRKDVADLRTDVAETRTHISEIRTDIGELRVQQTAMAKNIAAIDQGLTTLEERVDARLQETRPIWEAVQEQVQRLIERFDLMLHDLYEVRIDVRVHHRRLGEIERRVPS
ncbi:MAG TPA: hypothetical protein VGC60_19995 [Pyrinomonadaceae bacterium]